jgi:hypothetical protein
VLIDITATVILHELMHTAVVTFEANNERRIWDLAANIDGGPKQRLYGPINVKILARSGLDRVGLFAVTNGKLPRSEME